MQLKLAYMTPHELIPNSRNWKLHPPRQMELMADVISRVGWAGAVLINSRTVRLEEAANQPYFAAPLP